MSYPVFDDLTDEFKAIQVNLSSALAESRAANAQALLLAGIFPDAIRDLRDMVERMARRYLALEKEAADVFELSPADAAKQKKRLDYLEKDIVTLSKALEAMEQAEALYAERVAAFWEFMSRRRREYENLQKWVWTLEDVVDTQMNELEFLYPLHLQNLQSCNQPPKRS